MSQSTSFDLSRSHASLHLRPLTPQISLLIAVLLVTSASKTIDGASTATATAHRRSILGFTEKQGNTSFLCSSSGPCLPCEYAEKNDEKYHCSETGYRIPLMCEEIQNSSNGDGQNPKRRLSSLHDMDNAHLQPYKVNLRRSFSVMRHWNWRRLLDTLSVPNAGKQSYITYRSCLRVETEERLSVFGFEVIMVCLLLASASVAYFRQRHSTPLANIGLVRLPNSSLRI